MWKFLVKNQSIEIVEREILADHQIQYVQFKFTFDGDWKHFHKVVQFSQCDEVYSVVLGTDGTTLYLPAELHAGAVKMAVFGYDTESDTTVRATTVPVTLNIRESGFEGDEPPIPPTPDLYTQLLKRIEDAEHGLDGKSAYEIAVERGFSGTEAEWLDSLKANIDLSLYATNERLNEQILLLREAMQPLENLAHSHQNKDVLDALTTSLLEDLRGLQQFEEGTQYDIRSLRELLNNYSNTAHTHENKDVLDNISSELERLSITHPTARQLRQVIIDIRNAKLPDPKVIGNAGSFFMNPVVGRRKLDDLEPLYPTIPYFPIDNVRVKIPAGWLIEQCGWKGRSLGPAGVHDRQALVLVNRGGATGNDIVCLCRAIQNDVQQKFGIEIHPEVNIV